MTYKLKKLKLMRAYAQFQEEARKGNLVQGSIYQVRQHHHLGVVTGVIRGTFVSAVSKSPEQNYHDYFRQNSILLKHPNNILFVGYYMYNISDPNPGLAPYVATPCFLFQETIVFPFVHMNDMSLNECLEKL